MTDLKQREDKIKEKRRQTSFRDFVKEMGSFIPVVLYKGKGEISRYPETDRLRVVPTNEYEDMRVDLINR